ncbi:MAG: mevalonate kinase, partial [Chloroflexi bacterium]|nr:mevalonate kinase [Chloroflexota bacterium]
MTMASAAGKAILLGEHAVVYGRPAIAVPVSAVRAHVQVEDWPGGEGVRIVATDLGRSYQLDGSYDDEYAPALQTTVRNVLERFAIHAPPALIITIRSDNPIARGKRSGTADATP